MIWKTSLLISCFLNSIINNVFELMRKSMFWFMLIYDQADFFLHLTLRRGGRLNSNWMLKTNWWSSKFRQTYLYKLTSFKRLSLSLSLTHTHKHIHARTHTHTHTQTLTHTLCIMTILTLWRIVAPGQQPNQKTLL